MSDEEEVEDITEGEMDEVEGEGREYTEEVVRT